MSLISRVIRRAAKTRTYRRLFKRKLNFKSLPITDKNSYIVKNKLRDLIPIGESVPEFVYASSGSSGRPTFWFRNQSQERTGALIHERIIKDNWQIRKNEETLVIICFSMGIWIAGVYTADSFRQLARRGYKFTVATPGIERADILQLLKNIAPVYRNIIIAGYPPFLMDIMVEAVKKTPAIVNKGLFFLTAGDKFSEQWRTDLLELVGQKDRCLVVNIYGSADAGIMGYETPLTIFLREKLFVSDEPMTQPGFYQYDPNFIYFEESKGELVITTNTAIPLVRYNIHDFGEIINGRTMTKILEDNHWLFQAKKLGWRAARDCFVVLRGRSDVAVTFYALNIYPENIRAGLEDKKIAKYVSGNFNAHVSETQKSRRQELHIDVELKEKVKIRKKIETLTGKVITDNLLKLNAEFRKLLSSIGERARPIINFIPYGTDSKPVLVRSLVYQRGKKPRMVV